MRAQRPGGLAVAAALAVVVWALAGCGAGAPKSQVLAQVSGGAGEVTRDQFSHWTDIYLRTAQLTQPAPPDPPKFEKCIAAKRTEFAHTRFPAGTRIPHVDTATLLAGCRSLYKALRDQALTFLVEGVWLRSEAANRHLELRPGELSGQLRRERQQLERSTHRPLATFMRSVGMSARDLAYQARVHALAHELGERETARLAAPTRAEVAAYIASHPSELQTPERRDLLIVVTRTSADARTALQRLRAGVPFARVARQFSIDPPSRRSGGLHRGYTPGEVGDPPIDAALARAPRGRLTGPVRGARGLVWIFRVKRIVPARPLAPSAARDKARSALIQARRERVLQSFERRLHRTWKRRTTCARGYAVPDCGRLERLPA
jgi:foldase protein PrsA